MRLFSEQQVQQFLADDWWPTGDWDAAVRNWAQHHPEKPALIDPPNREALTDGAPRRFTWAELNAEIDRVAQALFAGGVRADNIVGIQLPNISELAIAYLALARLGAIGTPFPVQYREHELSALLDVVKSTGFITATRVLTRDNAAAIVAMQPSVPSLKTVFAWGDTVPDGVVRLTDATVTDDGADDVVSEYHDYVNGRTIDLNDCVTICWTSGTENLPKGIPRAFGDWGAVGASTADAPGMTADSVILNPFPLVNMGAFGGLFCPWLFVGCTLVMHHPFDLPVFLSQIQNEKVTYTVVPPAVLTMLLQKPEILNSFDLSSLTVVGTGSAPVPGATIRGWDTRGVEIINFFGSNEGLNLISDSTSVPDPDLRGMLFPSYRGDPSKMRVRAGKLTLVRLVDPETGEDIEVPDRAGELHLHGPTVFCGYVEGTGKASPFDEQGYYRSGDLFEFADDSLELLRYRGRASDMIVRGGFNISPAEIENVIIEHPDVAEVAIVGAPDEVLGERICAFIAPVGDAQPTVADLAAFMDAKGVAKFKWPERVEYVEALPRNPVGKVLHRDLRNQLEATAG